MRALKTTIYNNKNVYLLSFQMRAKLAPINTDKSALLDFVNTLLSLFSCSQLVLMLVVRLILYLSYTRTECDCI